MAAQSIPGPAEIQRILPHLRKTEKMELLALLEKKEQLQIEAACQERVVSHWRGPMFWLRNHSKTVNYHWMEQGRDPVAPFPYKPIREWWTVERIKALPFEHDLSIDDPPDYLDVVMGYLLSRMRLNVPKSREMMTSWLVVGYITWLCQFFPAIEAIAQSEKDEKAMGLIKYSNILYSNQPAWMKQLHPLKDGDDQGTLHEIAWENASRFVGVPQGERQVASFHPYLYFSDEAAHQPAYQSTVNVVQPVAKQIICVSSAAPGAFGLECTWCA